jgi:hypothetical protein
MNDELDTSTPEPTRPSRLSGLLPALTEDLGLKAVALLLALAFWGSVQLSTDVHEQLNLRLAFIAPEGQMVVGEKTFRVQINVVASLASMEQYQRRRKGAVLRVPTDSYGLGNSTVYLNRDLLALPKSMRVEAIRPSVVRVRLARRITRQVPVRAQLTGAPATGLKVKRWEVVPDQVTIDGPEEAVNALKEVIAGPVSVDKVVSNVLRTAPLRTGVMGVQVVDFHEAEVRVEIAAPLLDRQFKGVRVVVKAEGLEAIPQRLTLRLKGPLDTLNRLETGDLRALVPRELAEQTRLGTEVSVQLEGLPQGVVRLGPVPKVRLVKSAKKPKEKEPR